MEWNEIEMSTRQQAGQDTAARLYLGEGEPRTICEASAVMVGIVGTGQRLSLDVEGRTWTLDTKSWGLVWEKEYSVWQRPNPRQHY
jgi:hypothetical protein